eukprot:scaffold7934_cov59-Attheya_sp.AAC.4
MAAPYHADVSDIPSGAPSIASHTPNILHADGTSGINSILENDAPQTNIPTGTPSIVTHNPNHPAEGTTSDVGISGRCSVRDQQSLQSDIDGHCLFGEGKLKFDSTKRRALALNRHPEWWYSILCATHTPNHHAKGTTDGGATS